jgi:hypothetical protein
MRPLRAGDAQQMRRVVQRIDGVSRLGQESGMTALPARHVEDAGPDGQREQLDQSGDVMPILRIAEERLVLGEVAGVEVGRPPLG